MTSSDAQAMAAQGHVSFSPPVHSASSGALFLAAVGFLCLAMGSCALGLSLVVCPAGIMSSDYVGVLWIHSEAFSDQQRLANMVCNESWFKYLIPLLVPVTAWFGIANWVGWEYFRNA